jgi:hypothetical protein
MIAFHPLGMEYGEQCYFRPNVKISLGNAGYYFLKDTCGCMPGAIPK